MNGNILPLAADRGRVALLPIREAYEWKHSERSLRTSASIALLPIREAYEWKHSISKFSSSYFSFFLLPIREAYEWKRRSKESVPPVSSLYTLLPIREAYEWKLNIGVFQLIKDATCFQFVKRMNGNLCPSSS